MSNTLIRNKLSQVVPMLYMTSTGLKTYLLTSRQSIIADPSRLSQDITDKDTAEVFETSSTEVTPTTGFDAIV